MIVVFGTICIDKVRRVPFFPTPGGYVEVREETMMLGGEAANTANALAAWGADVQLQGNPIGPDEEGNLLRQLLGQHGLPLGEFVAGQGRTPICDIYVTDQGQRTMIGLGFSDMDALDADRTLSFREGEWFTADPNMSETSRRAAKRAHAAGMKLYLLDFFRPNETIPEGSFWQSSTDWAGTPDDPGANVAWVAAWANRHGCFTILTDSHRGFVAGAPGETPRVYPAFPVEPIVDSTGAGDVFRAGMLFGLDNKWPVEDCLRFASSAASLNCRSLGATTAVASVAEILAFSKSH